MDNPTTPVLEEVLSAWRAHINFIHLIARMNLDGEKIDEGDGVTEYVMENDDAVMTLNELIATARDMSGVLPDNIVEDQK